MYRLSNFYTDLDLIFESSSTAVQLPTKQISINKDIFINLCAQLVDKLKLHKDTATPFLIGKSTISPSCELSVYIESYSNFEFAEATNPNGSNKKVVLKYCFPGTYSSNFILPKSQRRKRVEFRHKFISNFIEYSFVKLNFDSFVSFAEYCRTSVDLQKST